MIRRIGMTASKADKLQHCAVSTRQASSKCTLTSPVPNHLCTVKLPPPPPPPHVCMMMVTGSPYPAQTFLDRLFAQPLPPPPPSYSFDTKWRLPQSSRGNTCSFCFDEVWLTRSQITDINAYSAMSNILITGLNPLSSGAIETKLQILHIVTSCGRRALLRRRPEDDEGTQLGREWNRTFIECKTRGYIGVGDSRIRHIRRLPDLVVAQYRNDPKPRGSARHESARITKQNN